MFLAKAIETPDKTFNRFLIVEQVQAVSFANFRIFIKPRLQQSTGNVESYQFWAT